MKTARALLALSLLLPLPAPAAEEEPEAAYARYHRGLLSGNVDEVLRNTADMQRSELNSLAPEQRSATVKSMATMVPPTFRLRARSMDPSGVGVRLILSGPLRLPGARKADTTMYGSIHMVNQRGEWRVAASEWNQLEPAGLAPTPASAPVYGAPAPPADPAAKAAPPPKGSPPEVGSLDAAPVRKLGRMKEPCVYKPVMSAEDIENCR